MGTVKTDTIWRWYPEFTENALTSWPHYIKNDFILVERHEWYKDFVLIRTTTGGMWNFTWDDIFDMDSVREYGVEQEREGYADMIIEQNHPSMHEMIKHWDYETYEYMQEIIARMTQK